MTILKSDMRILQFRFDFQFLKLTEFKYRSRKLKIDYLLYIIIYRIFTSKTNFWMGCYGSYNLIAKRFKSFHKLNFVYFFKYVFYFSICSLLLNFRIFVIFSCILIFFLTSLNFFSNYSDSFISFLLFPPCTFFGTFIDFFFDFLFNIFFLFLNSWYIIYEEHNKVRKNLLYMF